MINLKFKLDPKDKTQMLALSAFASTLANGVSVSVRANDLTPALKFDAASKEEEAYLKKAYEEVDAVDAANAPKAYDIAADVAAANAQAKEEKPEPTKRKRRTKAEIEAEKAEQENEKQDEEEQEDESDEAESEDAEEQGGEASTAERNGKRITLDDIRAAVAEKKDNHFKKMKAELKDRYGVETTPKLPVEHYAAFFDFVNGLK